MKKRFLALFLAVVTLIGVTSIENIVLAEETSSEITVYLSISKYGELVSSKDGYYVAYTEVTLSGNDSYTIADALLAAHEAHYPDGADGFASSENQSWGLSLDKLWGDTSYNFGYQINGGTESIMNLAHEVQDGDFIDAYIIKSSYPDSEPYTTFDCRSLEIAAETPFTLTLTEMGFDSDFNTIFSPCANATITLNGEETPFITNSDGEVTITVDTVGEYVVSAKKTKRVGNNVVTSITAPACNLTVTESQLAQLIHNISTSYINSDLTLEGSNLAWVLADLAVYHELYSDIGICLSDEQKQACLDMLIDDVKETTSPGELSKTIIALRSLGYDAKEVYTSALDKIDLVSRLTALVDSEDAAITNPYTLPYVIIALSQGENYATDTQIDYLLSVATDTKDSWQDTSWGTDSITPMLLALAPYVNTNPEIESAVSDSVEILKSMQMDSGLLTGPEGFESASCALAIVGLAAVGINPDTISLGENSLIDGLLSKATPELDGFDNAFAKEQGLRGLLAHRLLKNSGGRMYDFSDYPMNAAYATWAENCPVSFSVTPQKANITVEGAEPVKSSKYDLPAGTYTYTVTMNGYKTKTSSFIVSNSDALYHTPMEIKVSLAPVINNSGAIGGESPSSKDDSAKEPNVKPDENDEDAQKPQGKVLTPNTFPDVDETDWYYDSVKFAYENNLFEGTEQGFDPDGNMTRAMLATVLFRYESPTDAVLSGIFTDVPNDKWYSDGINWAAQNNIVNGITTSNFAPDENITREQIAVIIYRYAIYRGLDTQKYSGADISAYADFAEVSNYAIDAIVYACAEGILTGRSGGMLEPGSPATRAEVATILMRFISK